MSQVRISESSHQLLRTIAVKEGRSMQDILDKAIEGYRRKAFLEGLSEDFRKLRENPAEWADYQGETKDWDSTISDGLDKG